MQALGIGRSQGRAPRATARSPPSSAPRSPARVAREARVFLFDEPNSALTDEESDELFREMHKLAGEGRIVLLVTHRLSDLVEHADRVAVIRDGKVRKIIDKAELTEEAIAEQLVVGTGRASRSPSPRLPDGDRPRDLPGRGLVARQRASRRRLHRRPWRGRRADGRRGLGRARAAPLVRRARTLHRVDPDRRRRVGARSSRRTAYVSGDARRQPLLELLGRREPRRPPRRAADRRADARAQEAADARDRRGVASSASWSRRGH